MSFIGLRDRLQPQFMVLTPDLTVAQVLETYPQAARVFVSLKTECVGCYLMSFCTLGEVADQYHLIVDDVLAELAKISTPWPKRVGDTTD